MTPPPPAIRLSGHISIHGSSPLAPLTRWLAREFREEHEDVEITVDPDPGYAPLGGFSRFITGRSDIVNASRRIDDQEAATAAQNGVEYLEVPVAIGVIAVMTNPQNDFVNCITMDQLRAIWDPQNVIDSWNDLDPGWPDQPIALHVHSDSGVRSAFVHALFGDDANIYLQYHAASFYDSVLVGNIQQTPNALGFVDYAYSPRSAEGARVLNIDAGDGCIAPSAEAVKLGTYKLFTEPLFLYFNKVSLERPEVRAFAEHYMQEAPWIAAAARYVPLASEQYRRNLALLMGCTTPEMRLGDGIILDGLGLPDCSELPPVTATPPDVDLPPGLESDRAALLAARDTLSGSRVLNWSKYRPISQWDGVRLDGAPQRVTALYLAAHHLSGELPPELGDLSNLTWLDLNDNRLRGEIPPELGNLPNLRVLGLSNNRLSGGLPPELGNLAGLMVLHLGGNNLSGCVPLELPALWSRQSGLEPCPALESDGPMPSTPIPDALATPEDLLNACATKGAVPESDSNPGLLSDCGVLLAARDTLAGSATLNWSSDKPIGSWDGVSLGGNTSARDSIAHDGLRVERGDTAGVGRPSCADVAESQRQRVER